MTNKERTTDRTDGERESSQDTVRQADSTDTDSAGGGLGSDAVTALLSFTGLGTLSSIGTAATDDDDKRVVVVGIGPGEHSYELQSRTYGGIELEQAGGNDSIDGGTAMGTLYHWNVDTYRVTSTLDSVKADGPVAFHFPDGWYAGSPDDLVVKGQESGRHEYEVASNSADLKLGWDTEGGDKDPDGGDDSERTGDYVTGVLKGQGEDWITVNDYPIQSLRVTEGHVAFL